MGDGSGHFEAYGATPVGGGADGSGALRYVSVVPLNGQGHRLYYEASRPDGSHDLRTELVPSL